jgi:hypothetical protein
MIETQTAITISNPPSMEVPKEDDSRFPGDGKTCGEMDEQERDYFEYEREVVVNDCLICGDCDCDSEKCELEIERQEYMAEYWADF